MWTKTHRLGKWTFIAAGAISIFSAFLGEMGFWLFLGATLLAAFVPVLYSYVLWKNEQPQ